MGVLKLAKANETRVIILVYYYSYVVLMFVEVCHSKCKLVGVFEKKSETDFLE
jgi:hypothetical protein